MELVVSVQFSQFHHKIRRVVNKSNAVKESWLLQMDLVRLVLIIWFQIQIRWLVFYHFVRSEKWSIKMDSVNNVMIIRWYQMIRKVVNHKQAVKKGRRFLKMVNVSFVKIIPCCPLTRKSVKYLHALVLTDRRFWLVVPVKTVNSLPLHQMIKRHVYPNNAVKAN